MAATVGAALLASVVWSAAQLAGSRAEESAARQDLADCRGMVGRVRSLRQRPAVAGTATIGTADLSRRIDQAARAADLADGSILRIEPGPARRVGESNYLEVPTQVQLRQLTLEQLFAFFHGVASDAGLNVRDVRLSAPRGEENGDRWTVEATLAYTVYSPRTRDDSPGIPDGATVEHQTIGRWENGSTHRPPPLCWV